MTPEKPAAALDLGEVARRQANIVRAGTIAELDLAKARARADYGPAGSPALTGWLPWLSAAAGEDRDWRPPSIDEQVLLLAPGGELSAAWILPGSYAGDFSAPESSGSKRVTRYRDGAIVSYDAEAHELEVTLPEGGSATIAAPGGVAITGNLSVDGNLSATGDISATGGVSAGGDVSDGLGSMAEMRQTFNDHIHPTGPGGTILATTTKMT
ncbi:MAG: phage baseplate assembly protein V [Bryobacterales bacterium]|nr:phage baseplate assembly protein V [Bryobacterales bacterium]